jgi:tetratricopeptide (TPR) repeat protein
MHLESWASAKRSIELARTHGGETIGLDFMTGECLENQEEWEEALVYYRKVAEAVPGYAEAWMGIGVCLCETGLVLEGLAHMNHAVELEPEYAEYRLVRAVWLRDSGKLGEAEKEYQALAEMDSGNWELYYDWAALYVRMDDYAMAIETMMQALKCEPNSALIHYRIAAIAYRQGSRQMGRDFLQQALSMDFSSYPEMLELIPELALDSSVTELIAHYKPHEN